MVESDIKVPKPRTLMKCHKCGNKLTVFKWFWIGICEKCNRDKIMKIDEERIHKREKTMKIDEERTQIEKKVIKIKEEKKKKKEIMERDIQSFVKKYYAKCDYFKRTVIYKMYTLGEIWPKFEMHNLNYVKEYFERNYSNLKRSINSGENADIDTQLTLKKFYEVGYDFLNDLNKIYRLFQKKGYNINYLIIVKTCADLCQDELDKERENNLNIEQKRITNRLGTNLTVKTVLKEFIKSPLNHDIKPEIVAKLLDRFGLKYQDNELHEVIKTIKEDIELEEFEASFGESKEKKLTLKGFEELSGYQFEKYMKELFENLGYTVMQTSLSGDQGADLIMLKNDEKIAVQIKKYSGKVTNKAIQEIVAAKNHYNTDKAMVVTSSSFTNSAIQLAISNKVDLWDGSKLKNLISEINKGANNHLRLDLSTKLKQKSDKIYASLKCPFCESSFNLDIKRFPRRGEKLSSKCPECDMPLDMNVQDECYNCKGCSKSYETIEEVYRHEEQCRKWKTRTFDCSSCNEKLILNDSEFKELKDKNKLIVNCPDCGKENIVIKKS